MVATVKHPKLCLSIHYREEYIYSIRINEEKHHSSYPYLAAHLYLIFSLQGRDHDYDSTYYYSMNSVPLI